jgi:hypothetical protein
MDTMVLKKIILHNGNTFLCTNGVPSGHAWTSLINSLVNWIIWTSTIKFCPFVPSQIKEDYELQVHGDDVNIHTNFLIPKENITKVIEWMLIEFNYRASYETENPIKDLDPNGLSNSSFLKRIINKQGMIDTPIFHIWEKILLGPEYSKCRNSRMTYLYRRMNDLTIFDPESKERLALYYSFIKHLPKMSHKEEREMYRLLFTLTNGFCVSLADRWQVFYSLFKISSVEFLSTKEYFLKYFSQLYTRNFLVYDDKSEYFDYWKEGKKSVTVGSLMENYDDVPLFINKSMFEILHTTGKRKRYRRHANKKRSKSNIFKGLMGTLYH